ncbi:hypothetical protein [Streptomyces sp. CA-111067]|uniref:hypothetical protein n=1 Tax=Streptomyces sp. CA-111067 TaxID=3240046 RepID=UPI003D961CDA
MTDTTIPAAQERPVPERLLGVRIAATDGGGAQMDIYTRTPDGTFYDGVLTLEPHVADMLRQAVVREIPDRPRLPVAAQVLQQRMEGWFVPVAAEAISRCPAAHSDDPTPCAGPVAVTVLDADNAGADGCEHHAARLLASLDGGRVYAVPDAAAGVALRVFTAAADTRPFPWITGDPGTDPDGLVTVQLDCDDWPEPECRTLTRRELAELLTGGRVTATEIF